MQSSHWSNVANIVSVRLAVMKYLCLCFSPSDGHLWYIRLNSHFSICRVLNYCVDSHPTGSQSFPPSGRSTQRQSVITFARPVMETCVSVQFVIAVAKWDIIVCKDNELFSLLPQCHKGFPNGHRQISRWKNVQNILPVRWAQSYVVAITRCKCGVL